MNYSTRITVYCFPFPIFFIRTNDFQSKKLLDFSTALSDPSSCILVSFGYLQLSTKSFDGKDNFLKAWENFIGEIWYQKLCRILLSVHKRASRLLVLGELGRYPLLIPALKLCLKYEYQFSISNNDSIISCTWAEMKQMSHLDSRIQNIKSLLNLTSLSGSSTIIGNGLDK